MSDDQKRKRHAAGKVIQNAAKRIMGLQSTPKMEVACRVVSEKLGVDGDRIVLARAVIEAGLASKKYVKMSPVFATPVAYQPSREEIERTVGVNGRGATRERLESWGVGWPPPKGWRKGLLEKADKASGVVKRSVTRRDRALRPTCFYKTPEWKRLRFRALDEHGQRCMCCGWMPDHGGKNYLVVDHIKSRRLHPELELEFSNLQVLCNQCNLGKGSFSKADFRQLEAQS